MQPNPIGRVATLSSYKPCFDQELSMELRRRLSSWGGAWKTKFADLEANNTVRDASGQGPEMTMITVIGHWSPWL